MRPDSNEDLFYCQIVSGAPTVHPISPLTTPDVREVGDAETSLLRELRPIFMGVGIQDGRWMHQNMAKEYATVVQFCFDNILSDHYETEELGDGFTRIILKDESIHCPNATTDLGPEEKSGRQVDKGR